MSQMKPITAPESFADITFPKAGIDVSGPYSRQKPVQMPTGDWGKTTPAGVNVRAFDPSTNRMRGGARPGMSRYIPQQVGGFAWLVQDLNGLVIEGTPMQTNSSGRVVTLSAVSQGNVYFADAGDTTWTLATNNTGNPTPLNFTGIVRSAPINQLLYFADGNNWCFFRPSDGTVNTWSASAGSLPVDGSNNTPRLIAVWRGRMVLGGLLLDPQSIFMSAQGDPTDFDYSPLSTTPTQAVAFTTGFFGLVGDVVTGFCPYTDDVLVIFADHSVWMVNGDPMAGGQLVLVSDKIGGAWGICWEKDPYGNIYFVSNKTGIYTLVPGNSPQRISQQIEFYLSQIDTGSNTIRLAWDDRFQGLHLFVTPTSQAAPATHFFWEQRTGGWWQDTFANNNHNPLCCVTFDGNSPDDRLTLIGSWDGYVRALDPAATTDDGYPINSSVVLGPIITQNLDSILFKDLQAVLGEQSGQVTFGIYVGKSAEAAISSQPIVSGIWNASRNGNNMIRRSDHALYVKISASNPWAFEQIRARVAGQGKVGARRNF